MLRRILWLPISKRSPRPLLDNPSARLLRFETKAAVSLGQGQGPKAEFAISEGKTAGAGGAFCGGKGMWRKDDFVNEI